MLNKTEHHKIVAKGLHKTDTTHLYVLRSYHYKWLSILNYIKMRQKAPFRTSTAHRKFWRRDG